MHYAICIRLCQNKKAYSDQGSVLWCRLKFKTDLIRQSVHSFNNWSRNNSNVALDWIFVSIKFVSRKMWGLRIEFRAIINFFRQQQHYSPFIWTHLFILTQSTVQTPFAHSTYRTTIFDFLVRTAPPCLHGALGCYIYIDERFRTLYVDLRIHKCEHLHGTM